MFLWARKCLGGPLGDRHPRVLHQELHVFVWLIINLIKRLSLESSAGFDDAWQFVGRVSILDPERGLQLFGIVSEVLTVEGVHVSVVVAEFLREAAVPLLLLVLLRHWQILFDYVSSPSVFLLRRRGPQYLIHVACLLIS